MSSSSNFWLFFLKQPITCYPEPPLIQLDHRMIWPPFQHLVHCRPLASLNHEPGTPLQGGEGTLPSLTTAQYWVTMDQGSGVTHEPLSEWRWIRTYLSVLGKGRCLHWRKDRFGMVSTRNEKDLTTCIILVLVWWWICKIKRSVKQAGENININKALEIVGQMLKSNLLNC